jgi:hypothetical protein
VNRTGLLACLIGLLACAPARVTDDDLRPESDLARPRAEASGRVEPLAAPPPDPQEPAMPPDVIRRPDLDRVARKGPGAFLAQVQLEPAFDASRRFGGFRIRTLLHEDKPIPTSLVRVGDVVRRVNGRRIDRPEDLFEVWKTLRAADEIVVEGLRDGQAFQARFPVWPPRVKRPAPAPLVLPPEPTPTTR